MRTVAIFVLLAVGGCGPAPLEHAQSTPDALAREVLAAIALRDAARLRALAVDEREFERRVWPGLPAARRERNLPWSYVWMDLRQKSEATLTRTLNQHGGRHYDLQHVRFDGHSTDHGTFRIHRETVVTVRSASGEVSGLRLFGSMIEAGGWKVFSYVVDE
jgi:hypothetical protein